MIRGDLYLVNFEPSVEGKPARVRPGVILTNDEANLRLPHLVVAPVTSNVRKLYPFDVLLPVGSCGLSETSKIQLNHVRGLNRTRLTRYVGALPQALLAEVDEKLRVHLGLG